MNFKYNIIYLFNYFIMNFNYININIYFVQYTRLKYDFYNFNTYLH